MCFNVKRSLRTDVNGIHVHCVSIHSKIQLFGESIVDRSTYNSVMNVMHHYSLIIRYTHFAPILDKLLSIFVNAKTGCENRTFTESELVPPA